MSLRYRWFRKTKTQIFIASVITMAVVLSLSMVFTYFYVSTLLEKKEEQHITSLAGQINQRIHSTIQEIDSNSLEVALNPTIQSLLTKEKDGKSLAIDDQIAIRGVFLDKIRFSNTIDSMQLYSETAMLYPIGDRGKQTLLPDKWRAVADTQQGKLAWIGNNPSDSDELLAIRQIRLIEQGYMAYGYLMVAVSKEFIYLAEESFPEVQGIKVYLLSQQNDILAANTDDPVPATLDKEYITVQSTSSNTQWTVLILSPIDNVRKSLYSLQTLYVVVCIIGIVVFSIFSVLLSNIITKPMRKMITSLNHTHDGLLTTNSDMYYNYEVDQLNREYNTIIHKNNTLVKEVYHKELATTQAEIKAIQAQINPHFLFNTLEALYWTLQEKGDEEISEQVLALSDMFRYTIQHTSNSTWVQLQEEIRHIHIYLEIMRFRIGERLSWSIDIPDVLLEVKIPKLLIQPIVENSIKYGIEQKEGPGIISITGEELEERRYRISITDNGIGMSPDRLEQLKSDLLHYVAPSSHHRGAGIGLLNVQRRIQLNFHMNQPIEIVSTQGKGTTVIITLHKEIQEYGV